MFVTAGARDRLLKDERSRFLQKEWPQVRATIDRLGIDLETLLESGTDKKGDKNG